MAGEELIEIDIEDEDELTSLHPPVVTKQASFAYETKDRGFPLWKQHMEEYVTKTPELVRELICCTVISVFCWHSPKSLILPLMGGLTVRPIPFQKTSAGDVLLDLQLANKWIPKEETTIPSSLLVLTCVKLPLLICVLTFFVTRTKHDTHAILCTTMVTIGVTEFWTKVFKSYVGRLRPNFYDFCGFDSATLSCTNGWDHEMEARMSFPSGHSSLSFCAMTVMALYLLGKVGLGKQRATNPPFFCSIKILAFLSVTPLLYSSFVATSRLVDNWHHPSDIVAGTMLGVTCGILVYHMWYPHVLSPNAGKPLSSLGRSDDTIARTFEQKATSFHE
mmetsp:Transcript_27359/g.49693  ORF Transcript_27359/g.49693 Transcript_27359/m.49693 type:complete len:334 (-) Transcript_27359:790-1791(-)